MADKTTGELPVVNVGDLQAAPDIYDDFKMPGEHQGEAVHITGAQFKNYAIAAAAAEADDARASKTAAAQSAATAQQGGQAAQSALRGVQDALKNLPAGDTLIINDLTTGGTSAALSAEMGKVLGRRPNKNLLHNWDFANCVNQRGKTVYTNAGYTIDRWLISKLSSVSTMGSLAVEEGGIRLRGGGTNSDLYFRQKLENGSALVGKTVTMSVLVDEVDGMWSFGQYSGSKFESIAAPGLHTVSFVWVENSYNGVQLWNTGAASGSIKVRAMKLELGDTQTLAYQKNGSLELTELPDYAEELAKCQRFQILGGLNGVMTYDYRALGGGVGFFVHLPVTMRGGGNPSLIDETGFSVLCQTDVASPSRSTSGNCNVSVKENGVYIYFQYVESDASEKLFLSVSIGSGFDRNL